jgi:ribosomal protein S18 acetylase RimI-like enzyme
MPALIDEAPLDNPVWSCLTTRHAQLAQGGPLARRYPAAFSPLSGIVAGAAENVEALHNLFAIGEEFDLAGEYTRETPVRWETRGQIRVVQMIRRGKAPLPAAAEPMSTLGAADVPDMLALVELTHPGPFRERTIELGGFVGMRRQGRLLAMAGERLWIGDYREVSGVCTHPEAQRKGFARALLVHVINKMLGAGQTPFLHVDSRNERAIALYEALGFVRRTEFPFVQLTKVG